MEATEHAFKPSSDRLLTLTFTNCLHALAKHQMEATEHALAINSLISLATLSSPRNHLPRRQFLPAIINNIVQAIAQFSRRKNMGLCVVLTGSGTVANVTLRQPSTAPRATVTFHGHFDILSVTATFLPQQSGASPAVPSGFAISLARSQGQIVGGLVVGELIAAGTVFVIAASFNNPSYHRLPLEEEAPNSASVGDGHSPVVSGAVDSGQARAESCGMSMYNCHLPSDVIWAPTARPPQPPPPC